MLRGNPLFRMPSFQMVVCGVVFLLLAPTHTQMNAAVDSLFINEVDVETPGIDDREFIELYDGGRGGVSLDGLSLLLFSDHDQRAYASFDLQGQQTDANGYFLLGGGALAGIDMVMANNTLQNGPDAVALYQAAAADMPPGTALTEENLIDALVYGQTVADESDLFLLLHPGEAAVNENEGDLKEYRSMQRCPDGGGGQRRTAAYRILAPTPKAATPCVLDEAPQIMATTPSSDEKRVRPDSDLTISFSEPVALAANWFSISCRQSGTLAAHVSGGDLTYRLQPQAPFLHGERCTVTILAEKVTDLDSQDPPDRLPTDYTWDFTIVPAEQMLINEVDADTAGVDKAEFIELFDGGEGTISLDGLCLVLFNGADDRSYKVFDLDGYATDGRGYFLLGNSAVSGVGVVFADGTLQNGPDAVALYSGDAADFPAGSAVTSEGLLDALVYSTGSEASAGLLPLLHSGETAVDEDGRGAKDDHSNQRCPNGAGGQRRTGAYRQNQPTPGAGSSCTEDAAPHVTDHEPGRGAQDVALETPLSLTFSEAVALAAGGVSLDCTRSGSHSLAVSGGPSRFTLTVKDPLTHGEECQAAVSKDSVTDLDNDDPPDEMAEAYAWTFTTRKGAVARHMVINEVDAATVGVDRAEFIELYDGGSGRTDLYGLELRLYNGGDDQVYRRFNLAGLQTDKEGYFVIGGSQIVGADITIADNVVQNGPDAVALYALDGAAGALDEDGLLDALVYHTNDKADPGLAFLLLADQPQVNEGQWRNPDLDSNQRCPNGQGGQRITSGYVQNTPTPGEANNCAVDIPPRIDAVFPVDGAANVPLNSTVEVRFSEAVTLQESWLRITCVQGGIVPYEMRGGPQEFTILPAQLAPGDDCTAVISGESVSDQDGRADSLAADYVWYFSTEEPPPSAELVARFTSNSPVTLGAAVQFTNLSQGPPPLTHTWEFGDGSPPLQAFSAQHLYTAAGTYTVTLTVETGAEETAVFSAPVEIRQPGHDTYVPLLCAAP